MADAEATVLLKVKADSSQAVKETDKLTESQKKLTKATQESASGFEKMLSSTKSAFGGLGEAMKGLNAGLEVIDKVIRTVDKAVDAQLLDRAQQFGMQVKNAAEATDQFHKALAKNPAALDETTRGLLQTRDAMDDLGRVTQKVVATVVVPVVNFLSDAVNGVSDAIDAVLNARERAAAKKFTEANRESQRGAVGLPGYTNSMNTDRFYGVPDVKGGDWQGTAGLLPSQRNGTRGGVVQPVYGFGGAMDSREIDIAINNATTPEERAALIKAREDQIAAEAEAERVRRAGWDNYINGRSIEGSIGGDVYNSPYWQRPGSDAINPKGISGRAGSSWDTGRGPGGYVDFGADRNDPSVEMKRRIGDTTEVVGAAYATLAGGITAAVDAAITGSDSIGRAAAKASAGVLKSLAVESTGRAVYEGALAIGSLAIQDYRGAAAHGLAAAKFAAAAAVTGSLAAGLGAVASGGGGGGGASAGAPAGGFGQATGGSSSSGPINVTINIGAGFSGDARVIQEAARRGVREAQLRGGRGNYATSVEG